MSECNPNYDVRYFVRGIQSTVPMNTVTQLQFKRGYDDITKATITHNLNDQSCCDLLELLEPWADLLEIREDNEVVWSGYVTSVEIGLNSIVVEASDFYVMSRYRALTADYDVNADQAENFKGLLLNATATDPLPIQIITYPTGVIEQRKATLSYNRIVFFILKELLEGGCDMVMLGTTMHVGALNLGRQLNLTGADFAGDITMRKAGELFARQVIVEGARDISSRYPSDAEVAAQESIYPLVQDLVYDETIQSQASADAIAKSRWEYSSGIVPRVVRAGDALQLRQGAVSIHDLIPSCIVTLDLTDELCVSEKQQFRLGTVDVTYTGGIENITISLQPIGTAAELEGITPDDDPGGGEGG